MPKLLSAIRQHQVTKEPTLKSTVPVHGAHYRDEGEGLHALLWQRVSNQKWRTTGNDDPWFEVALLWQAGQYRNGQHNTPATRGTRKIKKQNYNHDLMCG